MNKNYLLPLSVLTICFVGMTYITYQDAEAAKVVQTLAAPIVNQESSKSVPVHTLIPRLSEPSLSYEQESWYTPEEENKYLPHPEYLELPAEARELFRKRLCEKTSFCPECYSDSDCSGGLSCGVNFGDKVKFTCIKTDCQIDEDCGEGKVCRRASFPGVTAEPLYRCIEAGERQLGERCADFASHLDMTCAAGLICAMGRCQKACTGDTACPSGERCVPGFGGSTCMNTCKHDLECGPNGTCVREGGFGFCRQRFDDHPNCADVACDDSASCMAYASYTSVAFRCQDCCNPLDADSCGAGMVCGLGNSTCGSVCYDSCLDGECAAGERCAPVDEEFSRYGCVPDVEPAWSHK